MAQQGHPCNRNQCRTRNIEQKLVKLIISVIFTEQRWGKLVKLAIFIVFNKNIKGNLLKWSELCFCRMVQQEHPGSRSQSTILCQTKLTSCFSMCLPKKQNSKFDKCSMVFKQNANKTNSTMFVQGFCSSWRRKIWSVQGWILKTLGFQPWNSTFNFQTSIARLNFEPWLSILNLED